MNTDKLRGMIFWQSVSNSLSPNPQFTQIQP
jgi:hypothetical protein